MMTERKTVLSGAEQKRILKETVAYVKKDLLPNPEINAVTLYGSLIRGDFGKYDKPHRGRMYSDIDVLILVEDDFKIPDEWKSKVHVEEPTHRVYNVHKIDGKYVVQYIVITRSAYEDPQNREVAEEGGVPLTLSRSKNKNVVLFEKS